MQGVCVRRRMQGVCVRRRNYLAALDKHFDNFEVFNSSSPHDALAKLLGVVGTLLSSSAPLPPLAAPAPPQDMGAPGLGPVRRLGFPPAGPSGTVPAQQGLPASAPFHGHWANEGDLTMERELLMDAVEYRSAALKSEIDAKIRRDEEAAIEKSRKAKATRNQTRSDNAAARSLGVEATKLGRAAARS